jgi:hypothetical protein
MAAKEDKCKYLTKTDIRKPLPIIEPTGHLRFIIREGERILQQEWGLKIKYIGGYDFPPKGKWDADGEGGWKFVIDDEYASHYSWEDVPIIDEIKNYTPEERRAVMQEILPHVTNMFKEEYDAYLKRNEVSDENSD